MSWVHAYLAMSSAMDEERIDAIASLARMPARETETASPSDRRARAEQLASELLRIATALQEASA